MGVALSLLNGRVTYQLTTSFASAVGTYHLARGVGEFELIFLCVKVHGLNKENESRKRGTSPHIVHLFILDILCLHTSETICNTI